MAARRDGNGVDIKTILKGGLGVVLALGIAVVLVLAFWPRSVPSDGAAASASPVPSPSPSPSAAPEPSPVAEPAPTIASITVIGDGWTSGSSSDSGEQARFAWLLSDRLQVPMTPLAASGIGYVRGDTNFAGLAETIDPATGAVVVFGSSNDAGSDYAAIYEGASAAYAALTARAPQVPVLVIGPAYLDPAEQLSSAQLTNRDAVRDAATDAGLGFVDPVAEDWFAADDPALVAANGVNPNDAGQAYLADRIAPHVEALLAG